MYEIAPDVYLLRGTPDYLVNVYLIGDVLLDAGTRMATRGILRQLKSRRLTAHALTHAHPDHQGASKAVCDTFNVPLWCGEADVAAMESGDMHGQIPRNFVTRVQDLVWTGPAHPVARALHEGDVVAGFTVINTPGHSPGHVAYWRESDGVLILGDVAKNIDFFTMRRSLSEVPYIFTMHLAQSRQSIQKMAALKPRIVCFGHGKPLYDRAQFVEFARRLADAPIPAMA
jgi:hydroxyacylglutathione hydrolase